MEHRVQIDCNRAVVRIGFHDISHEIPPFAVDLGICTLCPQLLIFYFYVSIENKSLWVKINTIVVSSMLMGVEFYSNLAATIGIIIFVISATFTLISFSRSAAMKNEEGFQ